MSSDSEYDSSDSETESSLSASSSLEDINRQVEGYNDNDSFASISPASPTKLVNNFNFPDSVERHAVQNDPDLMTINMLSAIELQNTPRHTIFEEGVIHTLPVMFLKVNVVPGDFLPIITHSVHAKLVMKYALEHNNCFGVSNKLNRNEPTYGTIANIHKHSQQLQSLQVLGIKSVAQQRFEILSVDQFPGDLQFDPDQPSIVLAQIKIVSDVVLTYSSNKLCSMNCHVASHCNMCRKRRMLQTQWPTWVYNQFDANQLASCMLAKARILYKKVSFSDDPYLLSMQVTRLSIFSHKEVNSMLGLKSTILRLQHQLNYWNQKQLVQKFICANPGCGTPICSTSNVLTDGPQGTYCEPCEVVHNMITVTQLDNPDEIIAYDLRYECNWFPGYNWKIILCPNCYQVWGWRFVADSKLSLEPNVFYGLHLHAIKSVITASNRDDAMDIDE